MYSYSGGYGESLHEKGFVGLRGFLGAVEVGSGALGDADFEEGEGGENAVAASGGDGGGNQSPTARLRMAVSPPAVSAPWWETALREG